MEPVTLKLMDGIFSELTAGRFQGQQIISTPPPIKLNPRTLVPRKHSVNNLEELEAVPVFFPNLLGDCASLDRKFPHPTPRQNPPNLESRLFRMKKLLGAVVYYSQNTVGTLGSSELF